MGRYLVIKRSRFAGGEHMPGDIVEDPERAGVLEQRGFVVALDPVEAARSGSARAASDLPAGPANEAEPAHPEPHTPADHTEPEPIGVTDPEGRQPDEGGESMSVGAAAESPELPKVIDLSDVEPEEAPSVEDQEVEEEAGK